MAKVFFIGAGPGDPELITVKGQRLVKEADVILALGTRLGFNSTFFSYENINEQASIIQVDIEPKSLGRYFPITIGICADAKTTAIELYNEISLKIRTL